MHCTAFFVLIMVKKVNGIFYLSRDECVEYLMKAYQLRWCLTSWQNGKIKISYETSNLTRNHFLVFAYKINKTRQVQISKTELDLEILKL